MTQDSLQGGSHNLDLLRAVAVLSVYSAHLSHAVGFYNAGSLGRFGVIIFFVHTSCVLMASLERLQASGLSRLGELCRAFYLRRFFRIYPLAIFCILLVPLLQVPAHPTADYHWIGAKALAANLALSQNLFYAGNALNVLWSLPLEVQMYVLLPLVYLVIRRYRFGALVVLGAAVIAALTLPRLSGRLGVFSFAPCFAAGVMAYSLCGESRRRLTPWIWPLVVFLVILLFHPLDNISLYGKLPPAWALSLLLGLTFPFIRDMECGWINRISHWVAEKVIRHLSQSHFHHLVCRQADGQPSASAARAGSGFRLDLHPCNAVPQH